MLTFFRVIGAIVAGFVITFVLVVAVEFFSSIVHPIPSDFKGSQEEMCAHVANYPQWVLAVVVPLWGFTAFIGTWIAGWIGNRFSALFLGLLLLAAVLFNVWMLPYPGWFKVLQPIVVLAAVVLGDRWSVRPRPAVTSE